MTKNYCDRCGKECTKEEISMNKTSYEFLGVYQTKDLCDKCGIEYRKQLAGIVTKYKKEITNLLDEFEKGESNEDQVH